MDEILKANNFFEKHDVPICVFRMPYMEGNRKMHSHDFHEVMIVVRGTATHYYKGGEAVISMGDVFVIPPYQRHGYDVPEKCGVEVVNVLFDLKKLRMDMRDLVELPGYHALFAVQHTRHQEPHMKLNAHQLAKVLAIAEGIEVEQEGLAPGNEFARQTKLRELMLFLSRHFSHVASPSAAKTLELGNVISYMEKRLGEQLDFKDLARVAQMAPTTFRRVFQDSFACSPMAYLQQLRIKNAMLLLADPTRNISDVAYAVGFNDSGYFSRVFKQETGKTPKAFRRQI